MNKETATKVLKEVQKFVGESGEWGPKLYDHNHEELEPGQWSICFEGDPYDWTMEFQTKVTGVMVEPYNNCILYLFDLD